LETNASKFSTSRSELEKHLYLVTIKISIRVLNKGLLKVSHNTNMLLLVVIQ